MLFEAVTTNMRRSHIALGMVFTFSVAGQAFAGTSLSCAGFPKNVPVFTNGGASTYVQVCKIISLKAPLTASLNVTGNDGNVTAHGGQTEASIPVFARVIAQDASAAAATTLANSVVVSTDNGTVSSPKITVKFPVSLEIDYEVFTTSLTDISLSTVAGNVSADSYTSTVNAATNAGNVTLQSTSGNATVKVAAGDISLQGVDGDVNVKGQAGDVTIGLSGSGWTGKGLTVNTATGNILLSRPTGYQALITATSTVGEVDVDGTVKAFPASATITTGSGAPIKLTSLAGNVTVRTN